MFKYFEPNKIFAITSKAPKYVLVLFIIILTIGLTEALILSPEDYKQSHSVRIMYVHVPAAWTTLGIFSSITFLSILGYIFKIKKKFLFLKTNPLIDKKVIDEKIPKEIQAAGTCTYIILTASLCL